MITYFYVTSDIENTELLAKAAYVMTGGDEHGSYPISKFSRLPKKIPLHGEQVRSLKELGWKS